MRVAVTGGSGVVGSALVRHLVSGGHSVAALARSSASADRLEKLGAIPVAGDVLDMVSVDRLVAGAEMVFHVAGVNQMCALDSRPMWEVNVDGTRNVIEASSRSGVTRLIHTSSATTIGQEEGEVGSEATTHRGWFLSEYERSKVTAEQVALTGGRGLDVVVVNPSSVQGPGRATGTGRIFLAAARRRLPFVVDTTVSLVDIDDCARGHLLAAEKGIPGERYLLSGPALRVSAALAILADVLGTTVRPMYIPSSVLKLVAALIGASARLFGRQAPFCTEMARVLAHGHSYDGSKAARELGVVYTPAEETLARTVAWFRAEGLLLGGR